MDIPTILVPGIKGTTLVNTNTLDFDTIWSGIQSKFETIFDLELQLDPRFETEKKAIIERSDVEDLAYREAVAILGREVNSTIYIFGYDWRKSCRDNGKLLNLYVEYLKEKLKKDTFNFVTHSVGGMIFLCYLNEINPNYDHIAHAVMTVCPFQGSINALIALLVGEGGVKFPLFNSNDIFRKIARTFPSVYELCPVYDQAIAFDKDYKPRSSFNIYNPKHWQTNISKEKMFKSRLSDLKDFRVDKPAMIDLSTLDKETRGRMVIIVGKGEDTKGRVVVEEKTPDGKSDNFFNFDQDLHDGDGTVPLESATFYKNDVLTLAVDSKWYDGATHGFFLNDGRVQTVIKRFLKNDTSWKEWWTDIARTVEEVS